MEFFSSFKRNEIAIVAATEFRAKEKILLKNLTVGVKRMRVKISGISFFFNGVNLPCPLDLGECTSNSLPHPLSVMTAILYTPISKH